MNPNENEPTPPLTDEEREHRRVRYAQYWASKRVADEFAGAILMPESKVEEFRFVGKDPGNNGATVRCASQCNENAFRQSPKAIAERFKLWQSIQLWKG